MAAVSTPWGWAGKRGQRTFTFDCLDCGNKFKARNERAKRCPACRTIAAADRVAERKYQRETEVRTRSRNHNWGRLQYEIVSDPTGDFRPGNRLTDLDLKGSLALGNLPLGMHIRDRRAESVWVVAPGEAEAPGAFCLVAYGTD